MVLEKGSSFFLATWKGVSGLTTLTDFEVSMGAIGGPWAMGFFASWLKWGRILKS
jgi:hypothetical protein